VRDFLHKRDTYSIIQLRAVHNDISTANALGKEGRTPRLAVIAMPVILLSGLAIERATTGFLNITGNRYVNCNRCKRRITATEQQYVLSRVLLPFSISEGFSASTLPDMVIRPAIKSTNFEFC
jgi:hypothetical protein